jgi:hypothetical protein
MIFACLAFFAQAVYAQDIITKRNREKIQSQILEVSENYVTYKKFERPNGPDYTVAASDIAKIVYENKSEDIFEKDPATGKIRIRHIAATVQEKPEEVRTQQEEVRTKQPDNGTFAILSFDNKSVSFRAVSETPFSIVSLVSAERTFNATNITNTKGNIHIGTEVTATQGSSLLLGEAKNLRLPKDTEAKCIFADVPDGFVTKSIVFVVDDKAAPMTFDIASDTWVKPKQISLDRTPEEPYNAKSGEHDIVELLENNIIEADISGGDITYVNLKIRKLVPYAVNVKIPVGSFFVSANPSAQNMVATGEKKVRLTTDGWQTVQMPAACANRPKDIPGGNDKFSVQRSPAQEELTILMPALNRASAGTTVKQAAVWIITDNADYSDLGILLSGHVRAIGYETAARAMKICADAGIDITSKNIWRDRETIAEKLPAGELKNWLRSFDRPKTSATSPATTGGKNFQVRVKYMENDKIIPDATIYFFYYDGKKSALVDKTANTGNGKIVSFDVPLNDDGSSYSFLVLFSKEDIEEIRKQVGSNSIMMFRRPAGENCEYIELQINKGGGMSNQGCAIQMSYN